jgi:hypothetical protein
MSPRVSAIRQPAGTDREMSTMSAAGDVWWWRSRWYHSPRSRARRPSRSMATVEDRADGTVTVVE